MCVQVLLALGDYMNVQCHSCIGGTNVGEDIRKLDYGQHVVAGTPGRVFGKVTHTHEAEQVQNLMQGSDQNMLQPQSPVIHRQRVDEP